MAHNNPTPMPLSRDRNAPLFNPSQPRTLARYFDNLEDLFTRAQIIDDADKKRYAIRYVDIEIADQWDALEKFAPPATYAEWKTEVYTLYPGADSAVRYTRQGLLDYVAKSKQRGFRTLGDWAEFYRNYRTQSAWLITQQKISAIDQNRWCEDAIGDQMRDLRVRLQVKFPDVHPSEGYALSALDAAMRFELQGTSTGLSAPAVAPSTSAAPPTPSTGSAMPPNAPVKTEDIARILEYLQRVLPSASTSVPPQPTAAAPIPAARPPPNPSNSRSCHYCGRNGCFMATCDIANEDIRAGKIKRNIEGKIVLPSGSFIPRHITGEWMRDRINEWHRQNPGQIAAASIAYGALASDHVGGMLFEVIDGNTYSGRTATYTYRQDEHERIEELERELFQLRNQKFNGVEVPRWRGRPARASTPGPSTRVPPPSTPAPMPQPNSGKAPSAPASVPSNNATPSSSTSAVPPVASPNPTANVPEHPWPVHAMPPTCLRPSAMLQLRSRLRRFEIPRFALPLLSKTRSL